MKKLISFVFAMSIAVAGLGLASSPASALTLLFGPTEPGDPGAGQNLIGVQGLDVNGTLYDVTFQSGPCDEIYLACGAPGGHVPVFNTEADATAAAQALLDDVFLNIAQGNFDTEPWLTAGCQDDSQCRVQVVHDIGGNVEFEYALNDIQIVDIVVGGRTTLTNEQGTHRLGRFSPRPRSCRSRRPCCCSSQDWWRSSGCPGRDAGRPRSKPDRIIAGALPHGGWPGPNAKPERLKSKPGGVFRLRVFRGRRGALAPAGSANRSAGVWLFPKMA
jgi:hypothetical protein